MAPNILSLTASYVRTENTVYVRCCGIVSIVFFNEFDCLIDSDRSGHIGDIVYFINCDTKSGESHSGKTVDRSSDEERFDLAVDSFEVCEDLGKRFFAVFVSLMTHIFSGKSDYLFRFKVGIEGSLKKKDKEAFAGFATFHLFGLHFLCDNVRNDDIDSANVKTGHIAYSFFYVILNGEGNIGDLVAVFNGDLNGKIKTFRGSNNANAFLVDFTVPTIFFAEVSNF